MNKIFIHLNALHIQNFKPEIFPLPLHGETPRRGFNLGTEMGKESANME